MEDPVKAILWLIGLMFTVGCCGAAFAFGWAIVGRWFKWAPVNLTVNIQDYRDNQ